MQNYRIAVLKGDRVGPEIIEQAQRVLGCAAEKFDFAMEHTLVLLGSCVIDTAGTTLPQETVGICKTSDTILLDAMGGPEWDVLPGNQRPETGLLGIRKVLELFADLRPAVIFEPLRGASPVRPDIIDSSLDLMVVRELTGGVYFDERGTGQVDGTEAAYDTEMYSVPEIERIARVGLNMTCKRNGRLYSVDKASALDSSRLWRKTVTRIEKMEYPDVALSHMYVDNCAMQLVCNPSQFDAIVTSNLFGDILSDEASVIGGSIGMLASANLEAENPSVYEPIHGSAPDIAGQGIANPLAMIFSVAIVLKYSLSQPQVVSAIEAAVDTALRKARTPDLKEEGLKTVGCEEMGTPVCGLLWESGGP